MINSAAEKIRQLAQLHNVTAEKTTHDFLAEVISHLADDEAVPDEVEILLAKLRRAGVIDNKQLVQLMSEYLEESRTLSSGQSPRD